MRYFIALTLALFATTAAAQQNCAPEPLMHIRMIEAGFIPMIGGRHNDVVLWFYTNPETDEWMVHNVHVGSGVECHIGGGNNTIYPSEPAQPEGDPA